MKRPRGGNELTGPRELEAGQHGGDVVLKGSCQWGSSHKGRRVDLTLHAVGPAPHSDTWFRGHGLPGSVLAEPPMPWGISWSPPLGLGARYNHISGAVFRAGGE